MHRAYKLINKSEMTLIHTKLDLAIRKWTNLWCNSDSINYELTLSALNNLSLLTNDDTVWFVGEVNNRFSIGLHWSEKFPEIVYDSFVNIKTAFKNEVSIDTAIANKLVNRSITSLLEMSIHEFNAKDNKLGSSELTSVDFVTELMRPGSGYVLATITFSTGAYLSIAFDTKYLIEVTQHNEDASTLYPAINAFGNSTVTLSATIGTAELDINDLSRLSVGDVISIDKKLTDKVGLYIDGQKICRGFLGQKDNMMSIKVDE